MLVKGKTAVLLVLLLIIGGAFSVVSEPLTIAFGDPPNPPDFGGSPGGGVTPCGDPVPGGGNPGGDD